MFEVSLFGPGYGECVLVRIDKDKWVIVDSCHDNYGEPAALSYLKSIGVSVDQVIMVVVTHWHDDHVRGLSKIVEVCTKAKFCMSHVFTNKEFVAFLSAYSQAQVTDKFSSGGKEMIQILKVLSQRGQIVTKAEPDRRLYQCSALDGSPIEIWSLSPSDECLDRFMGFVADNMPKKGESRKRLPSIYSNETAVALLVKYGDHSVLLGADLEETHRGWTSILASCGRPTDKSSLFKIPHHGSSNGHHDGVWEKMLVEKPISILTPYNRGYKLPKKEDIDRISSLSDKTYTTRIVRSGRTVNRSKSVLKMIDATVKEISVIDTGVGHIRATLPSGQTEWHVELLNGAQVL
ncbi:MBL fold metallo-hydrolase [Pseudomonas stutzeri]|uniref:MBL fold metallo-hydrolase n=1 Tax=Stutzerimonas stutzeri TaxID=316 RepID=UPI00210BF388|nr:MBL fold metallo-hydrolase [Stutzerimonas stutzeri]MCQ4313483.1 MBL fold metallo-hydrolase [Stutzerimonas stutzeri]